MLFAPTVKSRKNLENENVYGKIYVIGNTVIDAVAQHLLLAEARSNLIEEIRFEVERYALVTVHRAENVNDPKTLKNFVEAFIESPIPIVFPIHPRTLKRLKEFNLYSRLASTKNVHLLPPVGYFDFLKLMKNCRLILYGDGNQIRDFVHINDLCKVIASILDEDQIEGTFNIGSGIPVSIRELAHIITKLAGLTMDPIYMPAGIGDIRNIYADISRAKKLLKFNPQIT